MSGFAEPRAFESDRDLARVIRLFADLHAATPHPDYQHPGGMEWWLRRIVKDDFKVFIWDDGDDIAGFVIDDAGYVIPRTADRAVKSRLHRARLRMRVRAGQALDPVEDDPLFRRREDFVHGTVEGQQLRHEEAVARTRGVDPAFCHERIGGFKVPKSVELREALLARGYEGSGSVSVELVFDVRGEPQVPALPMGYRLATLEDLGDDSYVELHRAAWSTVKPSEYDRRLHDIVTSMPDFRRDMVPVVLAPDGTPAAYCIGWFDGRTHTVEIEPLGTHPAYRKLGLGRAIVRDIHHRSWACGARSVMVWGSHANVAATRLYTSSGMEPRRTVRDYRRAL